MVRKKSELPPLTKHNQKNRFYWKNGKLLDRIEEQLIEQRTLAAMALEQKRGAVVGAVAWGYIRLSTERQVQENNTVEKQKEEITRYYEYQLKPLGYQLGGFITDLAQSAATPILKRPGGQKLNMMLRRGDAVITTTLDRCFRNVVDLRQTLDRWHKEGVSWHNIQYQIDTSTALGRYMVTIMCAFSELEKSMIRERMNASMERLEQKGFLVRGGERAPYGFKIRRKKFEGKMRKYLVPAPEDRLLPKVIVTLREKHKMTYSSIAKDLGERGALWPRYNHPLSDSDIRHLYEYERRLQEREKAANLPEPKKPGKPFDYSKLMPRAQRVG